MIGGDMPMQSQEELDAHYGPNGPAAAAQQFLEAMLLGEPENAWAHASAEFREELRDADLLAEWKSTIDLDLDSYRAGRWGFGSRPRVLSPDRELVLLVESEPGEVITGPQLRRTAPFVMELRLEGWRVVSLCDPR